MWKSWENWWKQMAKFGLGWPPQGPVDLKGVDKVWLSQLTLKIFDDFGDCASCRSAGGRWTTQFKNRFVNTDPKFLEWSLTIEWQEYSGWRTEYLSKHWMVFDLLMGSKGCLHLKVILLRQAKRTSSWHVDTMYIYIYLYISNTMLMQTSTVFMVVDRLNVSCTCKQGLNSCSNLMSIIGISTRLAIQVTCQLILQVLSEANSPQWTWQTSGEHINGQYGSTETA